MIAAGFITIEQGKEAANQALSFSSGQQYTLKSPYFVQYVKQELIKCMEKTMWRAVG
jgi:membrane carboxypeptidase/penicillin-binding protein